MDPIRVLRLSLAFRSRSASRRLSLNYKGIESIGVSRFLRKLADLEPLRARLLPEPAFSDPSPAPQLRQNRIKRASLQADQYGATTTAQFGFHHWMFSRSRRACHSKRTKTNAKPMQKRYSLTPHKARRPFWVSLKTFDQRRSLCPWRLGEIPQQVFR
jgi:hypothetical protein